MVCAWIILIYICKTNLHYGYISYLEVFCKVFIYQFSYFITIIVMSRSVHRGSSGTITYCGKCCIINSMALNKLLDSQLSIHWGVHRTKIQFIQTIDM